MSLPAPHLDDRGFQSLVDDAKRMVQQQCPEWTDHNVSDPGVTLIETFAYMVDQMIWRLNRVPDRLYIKFLELIGLRLQAPTAARAPVTFWLSAPQEDVVNVRSGTIVATPRTDDDAVTFTTLDDLSIVPCALDRVASEHGGQQVDHTDALVVGRGFGCFGHPPNVGDCFYVGLSDAVPSCAVTLRLGCEIEGVGVDPRDPPIVWEAWDGGMWVGCEVETDGTGGLNRPGDLILHVPPSHRTHAAIVRHAAGWLRCRLVDNEPGQPTYTASPRITSLSAFTIGGTTQTVNASVVTDEVVGQSEGVPGQRFALRERPVVPGDRPLGHLVEVSGPDGWDEWAEVEDFAASGEDDHHFLIDETPGEIVFGPAVREPDGMLRRFGAVPERGMPVRIREYRAGGGRRGNVAVGAIGVLKSSVPFIARVSNRRGAVGGTEAEDIEQAKMRGPVLLQTRQRAVTPNDYENLARAATNEVARVRCVAADGAESDGPDAGGVRVLLVPEVEDGPHGDLDFAQMVPADIVYSTVSEYLDDRRVLGARVLVRPPAYVGVTVVTRLRARPRANPDLLESAALRALYGYFHPVRGGPDGTGWPFGRSVVAGEVHAVLQRLAGVDIVEEVRLYPANPIDQTREAETDRIDLGPHDLVFSWGHHVLVEAG